MKQCDICDGLYPESKHDFEECYSLDFEWDLKQIDDGVMKIITIQSVVRGFLCRKSRMPNIIYMMRNTLSDNNITCSKINEDGRTNSCYDEDTVKKLLLKKYTERVILQPPRMWNDILVRDYRYGWIPVNIKTTTTITSDNTGNLAMCLYAYTNCNMDLHKSYKNGKISKLLTDALSKKNYNYKKKRDYYFIVINKNNPIDVIINSVKGLSVLCSNLSNLPFQVRWRSNRNFQDVPIRKSIDQFIRAIQKPNVCWREEFLNDMRILNS